MTDGPSQPPTGFASPLPRTVWIMAVVGFLIAVGFGVMSPVLPVYVRLFGVSSFLVGLVVSAFAIVRLMTNPAASWLLRFLGPKQVVIIGDLLIAATTFLMGVSDSYWSILLWRGLSGIGSALHGVGSLALIFAVTPPPLRGRANALSGGGYVVGGMAGPAIGGLVAQISYQAPFFFYAAALFAAAITVWLAVPASERSAATTGTAGQTLRQLGRDRRFRAAMAVNFANSWQSFGVRSLLVPLFVVETLRHSPSATGWAFTAAAIVQFICLQPAGWASDRLGRKPTLLTGLLIMTAVSSVLALSPNYAVLVTLLCLYSVGAATTGSGAQALLADALPPGARSGLALYQMAGDSGLILGPLIAGALLDTVSLYAAWSLGAVFLLVAAVAVGLMKPVSPVPAEPAQRLSPEDADSAE
ncbi:MAG: MFS transporter [Propionibacteriaceae bacterium]|jgi:MFS family permease|nr:MFS transporter [Propionibacteriaceae bacterium]